MWSKDHSRIICSGKTLKLCKTYRIFYHVPLLLRWWWPHRHIQPQKTLFWCFPKSWHPNHSCYPFDKYIILPIGKMFLVNIALYLFRWTLFSVWKYCLKGYKTVPNHSPEYLLFRWTVLRGVIWHIVFFRDLNFLGIWAKVKNFLRLSYLPLEFTILR